MSADDDRQRHLWTQARAFAARSRHDIEPPTAWCAWAACGNPAVDTIDDYPMCRPHITTHFLLAMEDEVVDRDCTRCGASFRSATPQRRSCQTCTDAKRGRAAA